FSALYDAFPQCSRRIELPNHRTDFYMCCDEIKDIRYTKAIMLILELVLFIMSEECFLIEEQINNFFDSFLSELPYYLLRSITFQGSNMIIEWGNNLVTSLFSSYISCPKLECLNKEKRGIKQYIGYYVRKGRENLCIRGYFRFFYYLA